MVVSLLPTFVRLLVIGSLVLSTTALAIRDDYKSKCNKPKVRKEWRQLSTSEKEDWLRAVNCLGDQPHDSRLQPTVASNISLIPPVATNSSFYDDLVYVHMDLNVNIHYTGYFLPWHRAYLQFFEDSLINKCGYEGSQPYWDWTIDAHDIENGTIWSDDSESGLGRWGDPNDDYQIHTGALKDQQRAYPFLHNIRRRFTLYPFRNPLAGPLYDPNSMITPNSSMTQQNVTDIINGFAGDFIGFHAWFESATWLHGGAHVMLGGDMTGYCPNDVPPPDCNAGPKWTPNDPMFFLHHAYVDKVWWEWQHKLDMNKKAFGGGSVSVIGSDNFLNFPTGMPPYLTLNSTIPSDGMWEDVSIWDMIDTQAGGLCYTYQ